MANDLQELLSGLVAVDYDAIAAYDAAIERLKDNEAKANLHKFRGDHERHTRELGAVIAETGGTPPRQGDMKSYLTQGKVVLAGMSSDDAILKAMKSNEDQTSNAYEEALKHPTAEGAVRTLLERNLEDERRHRAWIEMRLAKP